MLEQAVAERFELVLPAAVVAELERVLQRKFGGDAQRLQSTVETLVAIAIYEPPVPMSVEAVTGDPADDLILACAVAAEVDIIASGDRKHMLPVGEHRGVRIVTPQALLAELRSSS